MAVEPEASPLVTGVGSHATVRDRQSSLLAVTAFPAGWKTFVLEFK
jgi:hypothetical protein